MIVGGGGPVEREGFERAKMTVREIAAKALAWLVIATICALLLMLIALAFRVVRWGFGW